MHITLHRLIMQAPRGMVVDHVNGNRLDNRRCNLRLATTAENIRNMAIRGGTSQFKGVYYNTPRGRWRAHICCDRKKLNLGDYATEEAAARAYNKAAIELFGPFARLNPLPEAPSLLGAIVNS
jgi:hypothetical protein